jgi:hypothetical protein
VAAKEQQVKAYHLPNLLAFSVGRWHVAKKHAATNLARRRR